AQSDAGRRAPLPKPAADYLKAAAYLQQTGKNDLAAKYLQVAQDYRDELSAQEQVVLDEYMKALKPAAPSAPRPAASTPNFQATPTTGTGPDPTSPAALMPRTWDRGTTPTKGATVTSSPRTAQPAGTDHSQMMTLQGRSGSVDA